MKDLGTLAPSSSNRLEYQSFTLGVNSANQVVGYTYLPGPSANTDPAIQPGTSPVSQVAFVWSQGVMKDLNTLFSVNEADPLAEKKLVQEKQSEQGGNLSMKFNLNEVSNVLPFWEIVYTLKKVPSRR